MLKLCLHCGQEFETQKNGTKRQYCFKCNPIGEQLSGSVLRKKIKTWALEYKGGKCEKCGYATSASALEFHHIDPSCKDFNISDSNLTLNWQSIKQELDKCILVCANCHREIHEEQINSSIIVDLEKKIVSNAKRVRCINTGEVFGSCQIAGSYFGISHASHIKEVCNGTRGFCGQHPETLEKLKWEWVDITSAEKAEFELKKQQFLENSKNNQQQKINKMQKLNSIQIQCSTGERFESIRAAAEWCGLSYQSITRALKNKNFTAGQHPVSKERLHWYKIEGDDNIEDPKE